MSNTNANSPKKGIPTKVVLPKNLEKNKTTGKLTKTPKKSKNRRGASFLASVEQDSIRFKIVWVLMVLGIVALIGRAFVIQVLNKDFYQEQGNKLITTTRTEPSYRGIITDRNGMPLAVSAPLVSLTFSPHDYANEYYQLKAQQLKYKNTPKELIKVNKRLADMNLNRLASVAGVDVNALKTAVKINDNVDVADPQAIKDALPTGAGSHFFALMDRVTPEVAKPVMDLDFAGVNAKTLYQRYYPQAQPNAQLLGFMANSQQDGEEKYQGRAGVERQFDEILSGKDGKVLMMKDAKNHGLKEIKQLVDEVPGKDVQLTIDSRLQYILYKELENVGRVQQARWATGIIVDVATGEVLALSNWPSYNPNDLNSITNENQRNHALIDVFEPGSVMKPFTVATALKSGQYNVNSVINTSPGTLNVKGYTIRDHGNLGTISFRTLLQKSSNVGSAKIALSLPPNVLSDTQKAFGFGKKTALNFPSEANGNIPTPKEGEISRRATVAYGYGLEVTLAQLAQGYATLGAGGVMHPLTLVKNIQDNAVNQSAIVGNNSIENNSIGTNTQSTNNAQSTPNATANSTTTSTVKPSVGVPYKAPAPIQVMKQKDALAIVNMMQSVTEPGGTATQAAIDGYRVAGKTGTAHRTNPNGGYYEDQYRTSFVGIAPASTPRLVVAIMVEDPKLQRFGGLVAAPVFKNVMREALRLYNVPFDKPLSGKEAKVDMNAVNDL